MNSNHSSNDAGGGGGGGSGGGGGGSGSGGCGGGRRPDAVRRSKSQGTASHRYRLVRTLAFNSSCPVPSDDTCVSATANQEEAEEGLQQHHHHHQANLNRAEAGRTNRSLLLLHRLQSTYTSFGTNVTPNNDFDSSHSLSLSFFSLSHFSYKQIIPSLSFSRCPIDPRHYTTLKSWKTRTVALASPQRLLYKAHISSSTTVQPDSFAGRFTWFVR